MRSAEIAADLVESLIASQFPEWSSLPVSPVEVDGWDNTTFVYACEPAGPAPGPHSFSRGGPVATWDEQTRANIDELREVIDASAVLDVWEAALAAGHDTPAAGISRSVDGHHTRRVSRATPGIYSAAT